MLKIFSVLLATTLIVSVISLPKHWGLPRFDGKYILVTGGDSGIGLAIVEAFYLECGSVMIVGHSSNKTDKAYNNIKNMTLPVNCTKPPKLGKLAIDVSKTDDVYTMINETINQIGGLDVAVNNAGVTSGDTSLGNSTFIETLENSATVNVNFYGTLKCMAAEIQYWLRTKKRGNIINLSSVCGVRGFCTAPLYTSTKWAMVGYSKEAALEYVSHNIRVNAVAPGTVNTTMLRKGLAPDDPAWIKKKKAIDAFIPMHRIAEPWEIAGPVTFLASDMSSYISGQTLVVDGLLTQK